MVEITVNQIKQLRERTGAGVMACKHALIATNGHLERARDYLRQMGETQAINKASRIIGEGIIIIKIEGNYGAMIEINCETDFVAKGTSLKIFGNKVISTAIVERLNDISMLKAKFKIKRLELMNKIAENIQISRLGVLEGDKLTAYLHSHRIGVIVHTSLSSNKQLCKHIAMHIAASKPKYVNQEQIPVETIEHERQIQQQIAKKSGKSSNLANQMIEGRLSKFIDELTLTGQRFILEPSKTVGQVLKEHHLKVINFIRFEIGENQSNMNSL
ncbi:MAG: translation elongation factor Ts [Candidatus Dasytiphilus stammeri]